MTTPAVSAYNLETTAFIKQTLCNFFETVSDLIEIRIYDISPFLHAFCYEYRKMRMFYTMVTSHFM